ncbi:hypothetical protein F1559_004795 [Cyanidiococcus yangmingshanensis]|uniref:DDHD domain-containing protein n=1 Tax=Cyanidiococcus yangmingshanensis TaxID=2690220 RepID=A0A7J7IPE8_9RHOD|nr:hypothetical protein F1559_004795 [Cyanidiococcus yangmingshanensis]
MLQLNPLGDQTPSRWRTLVNNKLMDILFYLTPSIKRFIQCEVVAQLNEEYERFRLKYPEFRGDISILGHSLGSVISYELLVQQVLGDPVMLEREGLRLRFPVHNLFLTGSPLGHVLNVDDELRSTIGCWPFRLVNIINPSDPAACRIEPILDPFFADIPPVEIPTMAGGKSSWLSFQSTGRQSPSLTNPAVHRGAQASTAPNVDQVESSTRFETASQNERHPGSANSEWVAEPGPVRAARTSQRMFNSPGSIEFQEWFPQLDAARKLVRRVRIDYVMRPNFMEDLWGLSAHLNYWRSRDVAHFIIHYIVRQQLEREQRHHAYRAQLERGTSTLKENHKSSTSITQKSERATFVVASSTAGTRLEASGEPLSTHSRRPDTPIIENARDESGYVPAATDEAGSRHIEQVSQLDDKSYSDFAKVGGAEHQDAEGANPRISRAPSANKVSTTTRSPSTQEHSGLDGTQCHRMQSEDVVDAEDAHQVPFQSPNRLSVAYPTVRSAFMTRFGGLRSVPDPETEVSGTPPETISSDIERADDSLGSNRISPLRPASV